MANGSVINGAAVVEETSLGEGAGNVSFSDEFDIFSIIISSVFF